MTDGIIVWTGTGEGVETCLVLHRNFNRDTTVVEGRDLACMVRVARLAFNNDDSCRPLEWDRRLCLTRLMLGVYTSESVMPGSFCP